MLSPPLNMKVFSVFSIAFQICPWQRYHFRIMKECSKYYSEVHPAKIYLFKVINRNTRKRYELCLKLTTKTPEIRHWWCSAVFIVNFEHISHLFVVILLLTLQLTVFSEEFYRRCLIDRSSPPEVFCEKGFLRNFAKFTGKYLRRSL